MFKIGDVVIRKREFMEEPYWEGFCKEQGLPMNAEFTIASHSPERSLVKIKSKSKGVVGVYDYKMELVNFSLENE